MSATSISANLNSQPSPSRTSFAPWPPEMDMFPSSAHVVLRRSTDTSGAGAERSWSRRAYRICYKSPNCNLACRCHIMIIEHVENLSDGPAQTDASLKLRLLRHYHKALSPLFHDAIDEMKSYGRIHLRRYGASFDKSGSKGSAWSLRERCTSPAIRHRIYYKITASCWA